jgi:hypothetical protein
MVPVAGAMLLAAPALAPILDRVSEEADVFAQQATKVVARERLLHRGRKAPPRFRPRIGAQAIESAAVLRYVEREIVSEFGFAAMKDAPGDLREFRQVIAVDGRVKRKPEKARLTLAANMTSDDDRRRKQMLQDFEKLGMVGAATDFSQVLLFFRRSQLSDYEFSPPRAAPWKGSPMFVVAFRQKAGSGGATVFHDKEMEQIAVTGELWVRADNFQPARITLRVPLLENGKPVMHSSDTEYYQSEYGLMLPSSVRYQRTENDILMVDNQASYTEYKMFRVDTDIKFTAEEPSGTK